MALTKPQRRALEGLVYLYEKHGQRVSPRQLARYLWPDSPAWGRTTHPRQQTGAMGGTMPMLGAKMLWRLREHGLAAIDHRWYDWSPTQAGVDLVHSVVHPEGDHDATSQAT